MSMNQSYDLNQYKFVQIKKRDWKKVSYLLILLDHESQHGSTGA